MPRSALPKHLQGDIDRVWAGTDNASWLMRQKKKLQYLLAAGPRVPSGFFRWRDIPITLFAMRGEGKYRLENSNGTSFFAAPDAHVIAPRVVYVSRIQPYTRWGIVLQWPLFFNCWFIYRKEDVVSPPRYKSAFGIKKMFTFGIGFKRDADKVYWLTANAGGNFE